LQPATGSSEAKVWVWWGHPKFQGKCFSVEYSQKKKKTRNEDQSKEERSSRVKFNKATVVLVLAS